MEIVVLTKVVPNTTGVERIADDGRLDRAAAEPIINPNDEHALEVALRLVDGGTDARITMLTMGPASSWPGLTKGLAVGVHRSVLVTDPALEGSCALSTANVLAAALRHEPFDLVLAGLDTADGRAGIVTSAVAQLLGLPFLAQASEVSVDAGMVRIRRLRDDGHEILEAPLPAVVTVTQTVGELRYPNLRGIMAAKSRQPISWDLAELGLSAADVGRGRATTAVLEVEPPMARPPTRVVSGSPAEVVVELVQFLSERRLIS